MTDTPATSATLSTEQVCDIAPPLGMTGRALRTANDTISRQIFELVALSKQLADARDALAAAHAKIGALLSDLAALQADRDHLWDMIYQPEYISTEKVTP